MIKLTKQKFSYFHNYHSLPQIFFGKEVFTYDNHILDYNPYLQAFLTRRRTHKSEVAPKISIIQHPKAYHNTLYQQKGYPIKNLYNLTMLRQMHGIDVLDTGYIISCFFQTFENEIIEATLEKLIISGFLTK